MAFEGTKAGFQSFLAAKQAGAHPLAQHLNFKSALKEARIAMKSKELEAERGRAFQREEGRLTREAALERTQVTTGAAVDVARIRTAFSGITDPIKIIDKASLVASREIKVGFMAEFDPDVQAKIQQRTRDITLAILADKGIALTENVKSLLFADRDTESRNLEAQEVDDLRNLSPEEVQDRSF